jgi:hypothetical protein
MQVQTTKLLMSLVVGAVVVSGTRVAFADKCKNVDIHVTNLFIHDGTQRQVKVVDFDYWDDTEGKWREENFVDNFILDYNGSDDIPDRNLEYVGGESGVQIRVQFKYMTTNNGWSEALDAYSNVFTCNNGEDVDVIID